jgi:hypothetical protein
VLPTSPPAPPPLITLRVTVRAHDLESFVTRYSRHIDGDRIFIFTKNPQPVATRIRFTLQLQSGEQLLHGKGTVTRVQDGGDPKHPAGMELVFVALDDRSQTLVDFMLASRAAELPPIARAVEAPAPPRPPPPKDSDAKQPEPAEREATISRKIRATIPPPPDEPVAPGPSPNIAEKWRDPLPPGAPAAGTEQTVEANPFTEVPDSAIDYFVEWSFEQSIGPRAQETSTFSDVAMVLPTPEAPPTTTAAETAGITATVPKLHGDSRIWLVAAVAFVAGGMGGVGGTLLLHPLHPLPQPVAALEPRAETPAATSPAPSTAVAPKNDAPTTITTRPPGAVAAVDGKPLGLTPVTASLSAGKHDVTLTKDRYQTVKSALEAPGELSITLKRPVALLRIASKPAGADVKIDGVARGKTPVAVKLPAYEKYDVELSQGARRWHRSVYLKESPNELRATLAAAAAPAPPLTKR